ncbi:hypothetical protein L917_21313 [Phytophthora nicotianae]|uniref:Uncharacterized protein n=1 Tax=Phytophthora nicotianae TaxID=4792 RepID=W2M406_PHYNI|nr:hypothetical protein L917_21313 [Phytophthora nicotianae]ETM31040.1 hypothetical protein L914_21314 [Phytophthora nicotianae]
MYTLFIKQLQIIDALYDELLCVGKIQVKFVVAIVHQLKRRKLLDFDSVKVNKLDDAVEVELTLPRTRIRHNRIRIRLQQNIVSHYRYALILEKSRNRSPFP